MFHKMQQYHAFNVQFQNIQIFSAHPAKSTGKSTVLVLGKNLNLKQWIFQWNLCCRTERWNFKIHWILHPAQPFHAPEKCLLVKFQK
jgi:hypothetical protein